MKCPQCNGEKVTIAFGCPGFKVIEMECSVCRGIGEIDDEHLEWIRVGKQCQDKRRAKRLLLHDVVTMTGIKAVDVSRMERGLDNPTRLVEALRELV